MRNIYYFIAACLALASCANTYNIQGTSNTASLDGRMLNLRILTDPNKEKIDSCDVVHGSFRLTGAYDSVCMARLYMGEESVLPLVLEEGVIKVTIDDTKRDVSGTPLNEALFAFMNQYNRLVSRAEEMKHEQAQAIMNGEDMEQVNRRLNAEAAHIVETEDSMVTAFIVENADNVLGPGIFYMITENMVYPLFTPQIEEIFSKASDKFKSDAFVSAFYARAIENRAILSGVKSGKLVKMETPFVGETPANEEQQQPADTQ